MPQRKVSEPVEAKTGNERPSEALIKQEALTVIEKANIVKITDQVSYNEAASLLLEQIMPFRKRWSEYWETVKAPAYQAYKAILAKFNEGDEPLERAERQVKGAIREWDQAEERKRQELQRQAEEATRKQQEEQRQRDAAVAEDFGATDEEVEAIRTTPVNIVAPPVAPTYQKASGIVSRDAWKAKVIDIKKLCLAVAKGQAPISYVEPNMPSLNARAKADRGTMNVPGVVAFNDPTIAGRTK